MISLDDFKKLEIRIGTVLEAERVSGSDKLVRLIFDFGTEKRQIVAGIAQSYPDLAVLIGAQMPAITNLEPRMLKGFESQGMILAASLDEGAVLLKPEREVPSGSAVR